MTKAKILILLGFVLTSFLSPAAFAWWPFGPSHPSIITDASINKSKILAQAHGLSSTALSLGVDAYEQAEQKGIDHRGILTIVDFSLPSTSKRLWVIDLKHNKVLYNTWVAHGENSGGNYATRFSNKVDSKESSLGIYVTGDPYVGSLGYSMRLHGVTPGYNTNAYDRNIVMHGAGYVGEQVIQKYGHLGYTWGCFGIDTNTLRSVIKTIKSGTLLLAYYPDSRFVRIADDWPENFTV